MFAFRNYIKFYLMNIENSCEDIFPLVIYYDAISNFMKMAVTLNCNIILTLGIVYNFLNFVYS